jgi:hypothetical protein
MKKRVVLISICVLMGGIFISCAATMPSGVSIEKSPEGDYQSVKRSLNADEFWKEAAINDAKEGADFFCAKNNKTAIILDEKTDYEGGLVNEKTDSLLKKGSDIILSSGGGATAVKAVDSATGDAKYVVKVRFMCE